jgi:hypothetical protein
MRALIVLALFRRGFDDTFARCFVKIKYSEKAVKQIKQIHGGDKKSAKMIIDGIEAYAKTPAELSISKP